MIAQHKLSMAMAAAVILLAQAAPAATPSSDNARVDKLIAQMTLDEKISLIHGAQDTSGDDQGQAGYWPGVARLGIPPFRLTDGPPGVLTRLPSTAVTATMALAATFSTKDARDSGRIIGLDAKALGQQVVLEPFINIHRDQTFARGYNTYGEDPVLAGQIAAAVIKGVQAQGVMAQAKHFIAYDGANDVTVDGQALREIYVEPFRAAVDAGVSSVMCSYNRLNGPYACGSSELLDGILRKELGFKGFVTSDWGATHATDFLAKGTDLEMPGLAARGTFFNAVPPVPRAVTGGGGAGGAGGALPEEPTPEPNRQGRTPEAMTGVLDALKSGAVKEADIDRAAGRVLYEMARFGWLDHPPSLKITPEPVAQSAVALRRTAADGAVLLKNTGVLPLRPADLRSLALIGPGAGQIIAVGDTGEKALGRIERQVSPLKALRAAAGPAGKGIIYAPANDMDGVAIPASAFSRLQASLDGGAPSADLAIDRTLKSGAALKAGAKASWSGDLNIPKDGRYRLQVQAIGASARLTLDGKPAAQTALRANLLQPGQDNILPTTDGLDNARIERQLAAGPRPFNLDVQADGSGAPVQVRLAWVTPEKAAADRQAAIAAARAARTAVVFAWSRDKPAFGLPGDQDRLIEDVAAANPNTVVVLNVTEPIAMPWLDKVKAVVLMWFPGDEGGWATADILTGKANPAGRLPFTWPARLEDNVANDPNHPERSSRGVDGKTTYGEGIMVGYRWFDSQKIKPLFPFGYGLSYSRFSYSGLKTQPAAGGAVQAQVQVRNDGTRDGDEVVQFYLGAPAKPVAGVQIAPEALAAFERVHLKAGESRLVTAVIPARRFQSWSGAKGGWVRIAGPRPLSAGASSRDLRQTVSLTP